MIPFRRKLFWKIYLTLLSSLLAVTCLVGLVFSLFDQNLGRHWSAMRLHRADQLVPARDGRPGEIGEAIDRLSRDLDADISLYAADGAFVAAHGDPIPLAASENGGIDTRLRMLRIDLPDDRVLLARLRPLGPAPGWRILAIVSIVTANVAFYRHVAHLDRNRVKNLYLS